MGNKYLNKNTKFQCGDGNAVCFSPQDGDVKVKINGKRALLEDCCICLIGSQMPGQCNRVRDPSTGAPGMCMAPMVSGSWNNNVKLKVGGKGVLSSGCSISCPAGGSIKPLKLSIVALNVCDEANVQIAGIAQQSGNGSENKTYDKKSTNGSNADYENRATKEQVVEKEQVAEKKQEEEEKRNDTVQEVKYALCDYKNCSKSKECAYIKAAHTLKETNESKNAAELKKNMGKDTFDLYVGDCAAIATSLYGSYMYSVAHHHIIPANQCFKPFAEIVKLANYYNYDINKAENGISLPTMNAGYDKQPFDLRRKIAFHAMEVLGRQWHKGGHGYSCKISAEIDSILPEPFKHYKDAVDDELTSFSIKLNEELKCRAENYDQQATEFIKAMDHICGRIAKKLRRFEDNPRKAYPYYVSKLAFYYAYQEELNGYEGELFGEEG